VRRGGSKRGKRWPWCLIPNIMPINFSSTFRQWATWISGILITDCPEAPLTTKRPVHMAERNGQHGITCFSSQMEDNTSNNCPRPFFSYNNNNNCSGILSTSEDCRSLAFVAWLEIRVCFWEDSCHDKVLGRPFHVYTHYLKRIS